MATEIQLPEYPRSGHGTALQLKTNQERYRQAITNLRSELAYAEDVFATALAAQDQRKQTQDRLRFMAQKNRKTNRR